LNSEPVNSGRMDCAVSDRLWSIVYGLSSMVYRLRTFPLRFSTQLSAQKIRRNRNFSILSAF
jgi:hypothetical protein